MDGVVGILVHDLGEAIGEDEQDGGRVAAEFDLVAGVAHLCYAPIYTVARTQSCRFARSPGKTVFIRRDLLVHDFFPYADFWA